MSSFTVNADRVSSSASKCASTSTAVRNSVSSLMTDLNDLSNSWQGSASDAFKVLIEEWRTTQNQVYANLDAIDQALKNASNAYRDVEALNTRLFRTN